MAIHWKIPFKSLRSGTVYTVNIYDSSYSGNPVTLKGGPNPFETQEDDDTDQFAPIRTQSGYVRIVDDGSFSWKELIPDTDTDRPVTLTNASNTVLWQGFMQAQNFSGRLYGNPQEREFPIQCSLAVTEGRNVDYTQTAIKNFAYLLKEIVDSIPSTCRPSTFYIEGGSDAQTMLLTCIDWQNFVAEDSNGALSARYNLYQCLEDLCKFWGWTARTHGTSLYLTCADDSDEQTWLTLTYSQLTTMAAGTAAGTTSAAFSRVTLSGNVFASDNNDDFRQRGYSKATVKADANAGEEKVVNFVNSKYTQYMDKLGWQARTLYDKKYLQYTVDMLSFDMSAVSGTAVNGYASFNILRIINGFDSHTDANAIRIKKTYTGSSFVSMQSDYVHLFNADGRLILHGKAYQRTSAIEDHNTNGVGNKNMYMKLGIGLTRNSAMWFNGTEWTSTETSFRVTLGNTDDVLHPRITSTNTRPVINLTSSMIGKMFVELLGSSDVDEIDGERIFDLANFDVTFERREWFSAMQENVKRNSSHEYKSNNTNSIRDEWNADCIFATDNNMPFGYGVLINADGTYMTGFRYNGSNVEVYPEQHLANRVTSFWSTSRRRLTLELMANAVADFTPMYLITVDDTTCHPISISREWRDDVLKITLLEI